MKIRLSLAAVAALAFTTAACDDTATAPQDGQAQFVKNGQPQPSLPTIVDIVVADDGEFDVLQTLVVRSGLADALSGNRPFTVFAPTDAAFGDLFTFLEVPGSTPEEQADAVCPETCPDFVVTTLGYHVVNGRRYSESVVNARQMTTQIGDRLYPDGATIRTSCDTSANLLEGLFDISASNGVIHVIDAVLLPAEVCEALL